MLTDKDMMDRMKNGWRGGKADGTICGQGSTIANTSRISVWLPDVCKRFGIESVCDAGAGDLHWIKNIEWTVEYQPFDLIPRSKLVKKLDIAKKAMPECDAILCRMVLNHLDDARIDKALTLFRQSSKYLIATHFENGGIQRDRQFCRLDLTGRLGEPIEACIDGHEDNCRLALWEL
jgi:hypothetical protein